MVMDADNMVYPNCLRRLADALDADPAAAFAYATLEAFGAQPGCAARRMVRRRGCARPTTSTPRRWSARDVSSATAATARTTSVYGWEDWELWLRLADAGEHGVHVPQMLGRYRTQARR